MGCVQSIEIQRLAKTVRDVTGEAEGEKSGKRKKCVLMEFAWWCPNPRTGQRWKRDFLSQDQPTILDREGATWFCHKQNQKPIAKGFGVASASSRRAKRL
jgi:hypothetical protein